MYCVNTNLCPGDILLLRSKSKGAKIIALATKGHCSHAAIFVGNGMFIEAMPHGVSPLSAYRVFVQHRKNIAVLRLNDEEFSKYPEIPNSAAEYAKSYQAQSYAFKEAFLSVFGGREPKPEEGMFCSHLVAKAYIDSGYRISEKPSHLVNPNDFLRSPIYDKLKNVTTDVTQYCEIVEDQGLSPIDVGDHTRGIEEVSKKFVEITNEANKILKEYNQSVVQEFTGLIALLVSIRDHRDIVEINNRICEIIDSKDLKQYTEGMEEHLQKIGDDTYKRAVNLTSNKKIDCEELADEISELYMFLSQKEVIYTEYTRMRDLLCMAYKNTGLTAIERFCELYVSLCLVYSKYKESISKASSVLEEYQLKNCPIG